MPTIKSEVQAATALTVTGLATLASATYAVSNTINHSTNDPLDVLIDVSVTVGATTNNQQVIVFCKGSLDGTNFGSGPETGTTATEEADLHFVGVVPCAGDSQVHRKIFSLAGAYGGVLPHSTKLVFKNDTGAALTAGSVQIAEVWGVAS